MEVCFSAADLRLFGAASHDRNPLHLDCKRARRGPYGGPVVFGGLGVLAAATVLPSAPRMELRAVQATFSQPMFADVPYTVAVEQRGDRRLAVAVADGASAVMRACFGFAAAPQAVTARVRSARPAIGRPRDLAVEELAGGARAAGVYGPAAGPVEALSRRFDLGGRLGGYALYSILFASYLVGMELPGEHGLLSSLRISLPGGAPGPAGVPLSYEGSVLDLDPRLGSVRVTAALSHGARRPVARVTCGAELQARPVPLDRERLARLLPAERSLEGRVAVVLGAGGSLGAAVVEGLRAQGCDVYAVARRGGPRAAPVLPPLRAVGLDCSNRRACEELRDRVLAECGGLDFLVCAAAPAIRPLRLHGASGERFLRFVESSLRLVGVPLATFLPALSERRGCCLLPSSTALRTMPPDWGHYVTAKAAIEAMASTASRSWSEVEIVAVRLPLLRTERLGALAKQEGATEIEAAAALVVRRLASRRVPGFEALDWEETG